MMANHHFSRVDTLKLKDHIYRKIGHQRAEMYFDQLKRFFSMKLSKADFNKICIRTIGKENISLHNKLIRSIVQNACSAKTPPQKSRKPEGLNVKTANGYQRNCLQSLYGDAFPQSPRKCRSPVNRDRKFRDRPSPLGPLGKSPSIETFTRTQEQQSATELHSIGSRPPVLEEGEEVEQFSESRRWSPVTAPIGVSFNTIGAPKAFHCGYTYNNLGDSCEISGDLPDTISLRSRLEKKLAPEGVGISLDAANLLNKSLDVFLKRIIEPCIGIAGPQRKDCPILGGQSNNQVMMPSGILPGRFSERMSRPNYVSMHDFRVAMESNPRVLGEDWSLQLEKICHYDST